MTTPTLHAVAPAAFATVQDTGRIGWRRFGLTAAGPMDAEALAAANALVGNPLEAAVVEFAHAGGEWRLAGADRRVAVTGGSFAVTIDGHPVRPHTSATLRAGQTLRIGGARDAVWGYLAVAGEMLLPKEFGSRATHVRSGIGGLHGRFLQAGDALPLAPGGDRKGPEQTLAWRFQSTDGPIRVVLGPQQDHFTAEAVAELLSGCYEVTWQGDRMGYRLQGPPLTHVGWFNIVSDELLPGSIQVPGNGQPIVMLMDAQTTGGYPKIATIISADLGRFAQRRPRSTVRFQGVARDDAQLLRCEYLYRLRATRLRVVDAPC